MFPHHNIHKYTRMPPDGKSCSQIDHILIEMHSSILGVQLFMPAYYDSDHYLVVAKVRWRLAVNKQRSHIFQMERFNLKKLNEVEVKGQYHVEGSNRFAALEDWTLKWILIELGKLSERISKQAKL
jgi:hypothetical protein